MSATHTWSRAALLLAVLLMPSAAAAQEAVAEHEARPRARAARLQRGIQLDGRLDDAAWADVTPATDFRQYDPANGQPGTQRTEIRFAYDDEAFYIGARMYDEQGQAGVRTRLGRRDQALNGSLAGDNVLFVFDTFHDHTGRTMFQVNPSGVKAEGGQASPFADPAWDPVWDLATTVDSLGWTAEMRIPFSQLRFPAADEQSWGVQVWRYIERLNETQMWAHWKRDDAGGPRLFGHVDGIRPPRRALALELMPYLLARADHVAPPAPNHPFTDGRERSWRAGGDVKALLSSTLTLDATFNPDFGQVEVDPAVVNLSAFETFFPEKRPFFVEGSGLFGFGGSNCMFCTNSQSLSLFYSRRIGRSPQGGLDQDADYEHRPDNTTILGAAKVTGRTASGVQVGLLNALTQSERGLGMSPVGDEFTQEIEPLTNYFVGRVKRNSPSGNLQLGAIATSVYRSFEGDNASLGRLLPSHAEAGGVDWNYSWAGRRFNLMGSLALSQVTGDSAAMLRIQRASARYFQRPDREHGSNAVFTDAFDPGLTSMRGLAGYSRVAQVQGKWLWEAQLDFRTPGFEVNDAAFLTRADYAVARFNIARQETTPGSWYRRWDVIAGASQQVNFDGDVTDRELHVWLGRETPGNWANTGFLIFWPERYDDRLTRGGAVVRRERSWLASGNIRTDGRKAVVLGLSGEGGEQSGGSNYSANLDIEFKPLSNVSVSLAPSWSWSRSELQYVGAFQDASATTFYGRRAVFAGIDQRVLSMDTRLSATFTPTLSLELFAQPFIASGSFDAFKEFVRPRTTATRTFTGQQVGSTSRPDGGTSTYTIDPDGNPATANFTFDNPDFNVRSLRGNAVLRWEYRPGSTLFLVWQQQRSGEQPFGSFRFDRDVDGVFNSHPDNIFVVKMSYWLGL